MPGKRKVAGEVREIPHNQIKAWRTFKGLTVEELAAKADLSIATISDVTTRKVDFTGKTLKQIADALETTPGALLDIDPNKSKPWWALWDTLSTPKEREQAVRVVEFWRDNR
jgi:transcriptional regulator with XRE-family HTH domain